MFELPSPTKAKVLDVRTLSRKDRKPDELPGMQLLLRATLHGSSLSMFDDTLRDFLFRKAEQKQGALDGMESAELSAVGEHVKRLPWHYEQTGCLTTIHWATTTLPLADCKAHKVQISPRPGDSYEVQWTVDALGLSDATRGKLSGLKSTEIDLTMVGPEVAQQPLIDAGLPEKRPKGHKGPWPFGDKGKENAPAKTAEETFADQHGVH